MLKNSEANHGGRPNDGKEHVLSGRLALGNSEINSDTNFGVMQGPRCGGVSSWILTVWFHKNLPSQLRAVVNPRRLGLGDGVLELLGLPDLLEDDGVLRLRAQRELRGMLTSSSHQMNVVKILTSNWWMSLVGIVVTRNWLTPTLMGLAVELNAGRLGNTAAISAAV